jgi:hypothetical protein
MAMGGFNYDRNYRKVLAVFDGMWKSRIHHTIGQIETTI